MSQINITTGVNVKCEKTLLPKIGTQLDTLKMVKKNLRVLILR